MPAPDLGPAPAHAASDKPLAVHLLPGLIASDALAGGVVIMIDALRASVTISAALAAGASAVHPTLTVEDAKALAQRFTRGGMPRERLVLGGERGGVLIPGFDLDNSPLAYTPERVAGKEVIFTTANGTSTLLHASAAAEIVIGALTNISAVCAAFAHDPRAVHIICSGTRGEISLDDCLGAGAIAERMLGAGRGFGSDDSGLACINLWREAQRTGLVEVMRSSRGGRNLGRLGFDADVRLCSTPDAINVLPVYEPKSGRITLH